MIVLVPSCLGYSDIIKPFFYFFKKRWPDCPYRVFLINSSFSFPGVTSVNHEDHGWIGNVLKFISDNNVTDNILLLLDDYMLLNPIDSRLVARCDEFMKSNEKIGYVRVIKFADNEYNTGYGWQWPGFVSYNDDYFVADVDIEYQKPGHRGLTRLPISLQPCLWNVEFIKKHFNPNWSPWQQEVLGSRELCSDGTVNGVKCDQLMLTTKDDWFLYCNAVRDGKYSSEFIDLIRSTPGFEDFRIRREIAGTPTPKEFDQLNARQVDGTYPSPQKIMV
jgi:hypothetical protein